ncbi:uncharacterized protein LOC118198452 [Stegodyphus dumicola]|uniref:uncharacterized protein LOC118198452 n=1 Tax=Stegodyphus dumicola TaxID=202533 RepID=UPI0015AA1FCB|nr:uncharacterized protein LOC118198452 [Stegodyphus dumicola]
MDISGSFLNLGTPLSVPSQPDPVEEQHIQELQRQLQPSPLQPQQHDTIHQSPQNQHIQQQRTGVSVIQPYTSSSGLTPQPQSLLQPQTPLTFVASLP